MFCNKQVQRPVSKRYLLCPAALTIRHLKKLISSKLDVTPEYQVCLLPAVLSLAGNLSSALSLFYVYTSDLEFELDIMSQVEALVGLSISPYGSPLVTLFFAFSEHIVSQTRGNNCPKNVHSLSYTDSTIIINAMTSQFQFLV